MREDCRSLIHTIFFIRIGTVRDPIGRGKVHRLADIGTITKTTMIRTRECYNEFAFVLDHFVYRDVSILYQTWTKHGSDMMQQIWYFTHLHGKITFKYLFQTLWCTFGYPWYTIPLFGRSHVMIIDTI